MYHDNCYWAAQDVPPPSYNLPECPLCSPAHLSSFNLYWPSCVATDRCKHREVFNYTISHYLLYRKRIAPFVLFVIYHSPR